MERFDSTILVDTKFPLRMTIYLYAHVTLVLVLALYETRNWDGGGLGMVLVGFAALVYCIGVTLLVLLLTPLGVRFRDFRPYLSILSLVSHVAPLAFLATIAYGMITPH